MRLRRFNTNSPTSHSVSGVPRSPRAGCFLFRWRSTRPVLFWTLVVVLFCAPFLAYFGISLMRVYVPLSTFFDENAESLKQTHTVWPNFPEHPVGAERIIPSMFHRSERHVVPARLQQLYQDTKNSCETVNDEFSWMIWDDEASRAFIDQEFHYFLDFYDAYPHNIQRVDAVRLFAMYKYGGVYIDADIGCLRKLERASYLFGCIFPETGPFGVSNDFFMCRPEHPFIKLLIDNLETAHNELPFILHASKYAYVMFSTGPAFIDRYLKYWFEEVQVAGKFLAQQDQVWILNEQLYSNNSNRNTSFLYHVEGSSWHAFDAVLLQFFSNHWPSVVAAVVLGAIYVWIDELSVLNNRTKLETVRALLRYCCCCFRQRIAALSPLRAVNLV